MVNTCPNCGCPIFPGETCCPDCPTTFVYKEAEEDIIVENNDWNKNYYVISFFVWFLVSLSAFVFGFMDGGFGIIVAIFVSLFVETILFYLVPKFVRKK